MEMLKVLRKRKGLTLKEVANYLGLTESGYHHYESGRSHPDIETLQKLAEFYDVPINVLTSKFNPDNLGYYDNTVYDDMTNVEKIPILGRVLAGYDGYAEQETIGYMEIEESLFKRFPGCFALRISGKSMEPEIYDGDTVIVMPCSTVVSGSVAIVCVNGDEGTVKRVVIDDQGITVIPTNPKYKSITYTPEQVNLLPVTINGRVIQVRHNYF